MVSTRRTRVRSDDIRDQTIQSIDLAASVIGTAHQRYFVQGGSIAPGTITFPTKYSSRAYVVACATARMGSQANIPYVPTVWTGSFTMYGSPSTAIYRWLSYGKR